MGKNVKNVHLIFKVIWYFNILTYNFVMALQRRHLYRDPEINSVSIFNV
jgi:hypothetical protein